MARFVIPSLTLVLLLIDKAPAQEDSSYQVEGVVEWAQQDFDSIRILTMGAGVNFYFTPVVPEDQPVPERPFMQQVGYVSAFGASLTYEDKMPSPLPDLDGTVYGVDLLVTDRDAQVGLGVGYQLTTVEDFFDLGPFGFADLEVSSLTAEVWLFVGSHSALIAGGNLEIFELTGDPVLADIFAEEETFHVRYKRVQRLAGSKWVTMEFGASVSNFDYDVDPTTEPQENTEVFFQFDVWLTPYVGVGAGLRINAGDDDPLKSDLSEQGTTVGVRAALNAGSRFGLSLAIENFSVDDDTVGEDATTVSLQVLARF